MTDTNHIEVLRAVRSVFDHIPQPCAERDALDAAITTLSARASAGEGGELAARFQRAADAANERANEHAGLNREWYLGRKDAFEDAITMLAAAPPAQAGASGGGDVAELVAAAEGLLEEDSVWDDDLEEEVSESAKARNKHVRAYQRLKSAVARFTTPASSATGQVAAGCAHVWVPGQAGMMYCDQCGRQKPAATPQPAAAQEDARATFKSHFPQFDLTEKSDAWGRPQFIHEHVESIFYGWKERASLITAPQPQPTINSSEIDSKLTDARPATPPAHGDGEGVKLLPCPRCQSDSNEHVRACRLDFDLLCARCEVCGLAVAEQWLMPWDNAAHVGIWNRATRPTPEAQEARDADTKRLDYIERTFSGVTNRERYLPVQMIWGKGCNGRTLREACDKYMKRDTALALPAQGEWNNG